MSDLPRKIWQDITTIDPSARGIQIRPSNAPPSSQTHKGEHLAMAEIKMSRLELNQETPAFKHHSPISSVLPENIATSPRPDQDRTQIELRVTSTLRGPAGKPVVSLAEMRVKLLLFPAVVLLTRHPSLPTKDIEVAQEHATTAYRAAKNDKCVDALQGRCAFYIGLASFLLFNAGMLDADLGVIPGREYFEEAASKADGAYQEGAWANLWLVFLDKCSTLSPTSNDPSEHGSKKLPRVRRLERGTRIPSFTTWSSSLPPENAANRRLTGFSDTNRMSWGSEKRPSIASNTPDSPTPHSWAFINGPRPPISAHERHLASRLHDLGEDDRSISPRMATATVQEDPIETNGSAGDSNHDGAHNNDIEVPLTLPLPGDLTSPTGGAPFPPPSPRLRPTFRRDTTSPRSTYQPPEFSGNIAPQPSLLSRRRKPSIFESMAQVITGEQEVKDDVELAEEGQSPYRPDFELDSGVSGGYLGRRSPVRSRLRESNAE